MNFFEKLWKSIFGPKKDETERDNGVSPQGPVPTEPKKEESKEVVQPTLPGLPESPDFMVAARKQLGKKETDSVFSKWVSGFWKLVGVDYNTISGNARAWCALFIVVIASSAGGYKYASTANARHQGEVTGVYHVIDWKKNGIPEGAIVHINHNGRCHEDGSNHVAFSNGSCAPQDILVSGKPKDVGFALLGGNQGNQVSIAYYPVKDICEVRYFKEKKLPDGTVVQIPMPAPVTVSKNCTGTIGKVSTQ